MLSREEIESLGFEYVMTESSEIPRHIFVKDNILLIYKSSQLHNSSEVTIKKNHRTVYKNTIEDIKTLNETIKKIPLVV